MPSWATDQKAKQLQQEVSPLPEGSPISAPAGVCLFALEPRSEREAALPPRWWVSPGLVSPRVGGGSHPSEVSPSQSCVSIRGPVGGSGGSGHCVSPRALAKVRSCPVQSPSPMSSSLSHVGKRGLWLLELPVLGTSSLHCLPLRLTMSLFCLVPPG